MKTIAVREFKTKCLSLLDEVNRTQEPIVVTKQGRPVAKVIPVPKESNGRRASLRGSVLSEKDLIHPIKG